MNEFKFLLFPLLVLLQQEVAAFTNPSCWNVTVTENDLTKEVFSKFERIQRPVLNTSLPIHVTLDLALSSINDVIEKSRIVELTGYLLINWQDEFRIWNNTYPLNCISSIVVPSNYVWLPDVALINGERRYNLMSIEGEKVRVMSNGYSTYSPGDVLRVFCQFDFSLFPFDEQTCRVIFESWRFSTEMETLGSLDSQVLIYQWLEHEQWALVGTEAVYTNYTYFEPEKKYSRVEFILHIKRKSTYYTIAIIVPGIIISFTQISVFSLPLEESKKISIMFTCLLAYLVFLLMVSADMPRTSDYTPLLSIYVNLSMASIAMSILGESIVFVFIRYSISRNPAGPVPMPNMLKSSTIFLGTSVLRMRREPWMGKKYAKKLAENASDGDQASTHSSSDNASTTAPLTDIERRRLQWRFAANVTDRVTFILYTVAVTICPITLFYLIPLF